MNTADSLVRSIFQKNSLDDCSLDELQNVAKQYPYFTPVQFLLIEKLKTDNNDLYHQQLQKISLRFHNPLWLDVLLNSQKTEMTKPAEEPIDHPEQSPTIGEKLESEETSLSNIETSEPAKKIATEEVNENSTEKIEATEEKEKFSAPGEADAENIDISSEEMNESPLSIPSLPDLKQTPAETELTFEPYHTVDYFASQGIKFISEEKPVDRFGQQLKSFTEWLKALKRQPETEIGKVITASSEEKVAQLADHSISEGDVVTEAMAEVWQKQGNKEKAIEIYNKLSLLNPAKSAYFASLAEQLKNS